MSQKALYVCVTGCGSEKQIHNWSVVGLAIPQTTSLFVLKIQHFVRIALCYTIIQYCKCL